jgi:hypothetical protein
LCFRVIHLLRQVTNQSYETGRRNSDSPEGLELDEWDTHYVLQVSCFL